MPSNPATGHYSVPLTRVSVEFKPTDLVAEKILPRVKVDKELDVYYEFDKSSFNIVNDERADGSPENESTGGWMEKSYYCRAYGLRDKITDRMRQNADSQIQLDVQTNNRLLQQLRNNLEWRVLGPGGLLRTSANLVSVDSTTNLSLTNASPRTAIQDMITDVQRSSGVMPNVLVANPDILRAMTRIPEYRDEVKHVADIRNMEVPDTLYGLKVVTASGLANITSAAPTRKGVAANLNWVMEDDIWIGYVAPSLGLRTLSYGCIFYTKTWTRKWWDDEAEVDWIAVNDIYEPKLIARECGALLQNPFKGA